MSERPYLWIQGKSVERLAEDLVDAGEGARVEFHFVGAEVEIPEHAQLHVVVIPPDRPAKDPIDDSHLCPPQCS